MKIDKDVVTNYIYEQIWLKFTEFVNGMTKSHTDIFND